MSTHTHAHDEVEAGVYGLMAEFDPGPRNCSTPPGRPEMPAIRKMDAYSPFPVHGFYEALDAKTVLPWLIFGGGLAGRPHRLRHAGRSPRRSITRSTSPASRW